MVKVMEVAVKVPVTSTLWEAGVAHAPANPTNDIQANVVTVKELAKATTILVGMILVDGVNVI